MRNSDCHFARSYMKRPESSSCFVLEIWEYVLVWLIGGRSLAGSLQPSDTAFRAPPPGTQAWPARLQAAARGVHGSAPAPAREPERVQRGARGPRPGGRHDARVGAALLGVDAETRVVDHEQGFLERRLHGREADDGEADEVVVVLGLHIK